jgi:3-phenylpropionate/trans-cinnamate dioxygenase ferredoxin reductase subunit
MERNTGTFVVGAGHAGAQTVASLLAGGYVDGVTVMSDEEVMPHDRPSLSKGYLTGECEIQDILLRKDEFWDSPGVELVRGVTVASVDAEVHTVTTADGRGFRYGSLV